MTILQNWLTRKKETLVADANPTTFVRCLQAHLGAARHPHSLSYPWDSWSLYNVLTSSQSCHFCSNSWSFPFLISAPFMSAFDFLFQLSPQFHFPFISRVFFSWTQEVLSFSPSRWNLWLTFSSLLFFYCLTFFFYEEIPKNLLPGPPWKLQEDLRPSMPFHELLDKCVSVFHPQLWI